MNERLDTQELRRLWNNASVGDEMDIANWAIDFAEPLMEALAQAQADVDRARDFTGAVLFAWRHSKNLKHDLRGLLAALPEYLKETNS